MLLRINFIPLVAMVPPHDKFGLRIWFDHDNKQTSLRVEAGLAGRRRSHESRDRSRGSGRG